MANLSNRIKELRAERGFSQQRLADLLRVSKSSINMYERGQREPSLETLGFMAEFFGVDMDFLIGKGDFRSKSDWLAQNAAKAGETAELPVLGSVSAGFGVLAAENVVGYEPAESRFADGEHFYLKVKGDSMSPKIEDGDLVLVRRQTSVDSGAIAVVIVDGEDGVLKRVVYGGDFIELHSFNPYYPMRVFRGGGVQRIYVVGLAVKTVRNL
jgi:repressor LexA